jgi:rhodanese-related sulfurtransferase
MNKNIYYKFSLAFLLSSLLLFSGCGTSDGGSDDTNNSTQKTINNILPVADAGSDITVVQNEMFTFDASNSYDSDGNITNYEWYCSDFNISLYTGPNSTLTIPAQRPLGSYHTKLTVTDDKNATMVDTVLVTIIAPVFIANAGGNQQVVQNTPIILDANKSFYAQGDITSYEWIYSDINRTLYKGSEISTSILATRSIGDYNITLIVTNDKNETAIDSFTLYVTEDNSAGFVDIMNTAITVEQFKELKSHDTIYIDVRALSEWNSETGIIEGSHTITRPSNISTWLQEGSEFLNLVTDKDQSFTLICAAGSRASLTANDLIANGYTNVHYLNSGINAWIAAGEPTIAY